ncbi:MAG: hypothetical protein INR69_16495 [Mucilaginibacter polytrichastri]|nr:hypothetical protein [Mucilaginibacter polytrichastri]
MPEMCAHETAARFSKRGFGAVRRIFGGEKGIIITVIVHVRDLQSLRQEKNQRETIRKKPM